MKKPIIEQLIIAGAAGNIEARLQIAVDRGDSFAIVCHPHPLHGGSMDNKVAHYAARAMLEAGVPVVRFNFRGVGASDGAFDNGRGEQEDLAAVVAWARRRFPGRGLILAGFSFGAYVAAAQASALSAWRLISVAPPVNMYDFAALKNTMPWLVLLGDQDEVVPVALARRWLQTPLNPFAQNRHAEWLAGAGHFFHGRLPELAARIREWLRAGSV